MANDETGISRITDQGEALRVEGVHEGRKSDFLVTKQNVLEIRAREGEAGLQAFLQRQLRGAREDVVQEELRRLRP